MFLFHLCVFFSLFIDDRAIVFSMIKESLNKLLSVLKKNDGQWKRIHEFEFFFWWCRLFEMNEKERQEEVLVCLKIMEAFFSSGGQRINYFCLCMELVISATASGCLWWGRWFFFSFV